MTSRMLGRAKQERGYRMDELLDKLKNDPELNNVQRVAILNGQIFKWEMLAQSVAVHSSELKEHVEKINKMKALKTELTDKT